MAQCFLTHRQRFATANDFTSDFHPVTSGVPQGTVLGPLLFLAYIDDLPNCVSSSIHLIADGCVLFREITISNDVPALQSDINAINSWCKTWHMTLNVNKCKFMPISSCHANLPTYHLDSSPLEFVESYKYLGVHITSNLSWQTHITFITNKANRMQGYLQFNFHSARTPIQLLFYKTIVRLQLEYASSILDPGVGILVTQLKMIQNNSARFIYSNYQRAASVSSMKFNLSLSSLAS